MSLTPAPLWWSQSSQGFSGGPEGCPDWSAKATVDSSISSRGCVHTSIFLGGMQDPIPAALSASSWVYGSSLSSFNLFIKTKRTPKSAQSNQCAALGLLQTDLHKGSKWPSLQLHLLCFCQTHSIAEVLQTSKDHPLAVMWLLRKF